jgi:RNA recognition motif-containing protein
MKEFIKKLCPVMALLCFVLCIVGASGVAKNAGDDELLKALGLFLYGVSIFVLFTLLALPVLASQPIMTAAKKNYKTDKKTNVSKNKNMKDDKQPSKPSKPAPKQSAADASQSSSEDENKIRRDSGEQINDEEGPVTLYVCDLAEDTSELDLREEFGVFGVVKSVRLVADRETGKPKGYAFVEMSNKAEAKLAMDDINGQEIKGQEVKVSYARRKKYGRKNYNNKK